MQLYYLAEEEQRAFLLHLRVEIDEDELEDVGGLLPVLLEGDLLEIIDSLVILDRRGHE